MKLNKLIELQTNGALKISGNPNINCAKIGGVELNDGQCRMLARQMGWTGRTSYCGWEMIDKTAKFVSNAKRNMQNENMINAIDLTFESTRKTDSVKYIERIVLNFSTGLTLTIIHGLEGIGGSYALFNPMKSVAQPELTCSSYRVLFNYIETAYAF